MNAVLTKLHLISAYQSWLGNPHAAMNAVIVADAWKMTPLAVIFFLAALQSFDKTTYEAAMVDGAGAFRRFITLTLPNLKPTILIIIVMRTVEKFKAFDIFYLMTRGGPADGTKTLMYDTYLQAFTNLNFSEAATYAYLIALIVALLTLTYVKIMKRGSD
ncbi:Lactose transport system permease protein LacF [bioreactor metagenome]|uniref:Lactose transport system permease protein LacF n=1 Tax=bioreactor metagenome TaxID=1076179 RepID=A0A645BRZ7_9ZZZZ